MAQRESNLPFAHLFRRRNQTSAQPPQLPADNTEREQRFPVYASQPPASSEHTISLASQTTRIALPTASQAHTSLPSSRPALLPIGKGHNYGIKILHDSRRDTSVHAVDIVFVHGLNGNAYDTWFHKDAKLHWPSQLLSKDIPDIRILSFGYDADIVDFWNPASVSKVTNHAENMIGDLVRLRERTDTEERPMIFVTHSLGGLVVEHALNFSRNTVEEHLHQIEKYTGGVVFLGVPHCGADLASWASVGTRLSNILRRTNQDIVGVLEPGSEMLRIVQQGFHNLLRRRKEERVELRITCFYEELPVLGVGVIVPLHSAEIKGYSCYGIHANHMDMSKFDGQADPGYDAVLGELQRWKKAISKNKDKIAMPEKSRKDSSRADGRPGLESDASGAKKVSEDVQNFFGDASTHQGQIFQGNFNNPSFNLSRPLHSVHVPEKLWIVPRRVSSVYTGREELLKQLATCFIDARSKLLPSQRVFTIIGLGGTGKSEVCLKYADTHGDRYWGVLWIDCTSVSTAEQGYINVGKQCGVSELSSETVKSFLASCNRHWLLILDNADDPDIDYSNILPSGNRGHILITSRLSECKKYNTAGHHELDCLGVQDAQRLLLRAAEIPGNCSENKREIAAKVVQILGSHTLAIVQAAAYIRQGYSTLEQYRSGFLEQRRDLLTFHSTQAQSTYGNVYATFEVSARYLAESQSEDATDAIHLLHIMSFMHNVDVAEIIFERACICKEAVRKYSFTSKIDEVFVLFPSRIARLPGFLQQDWSNYGRSRWRKACALLESMSLVSGKWDGDTRILSVHPLVHQWARDRQQQIFSASIAWQWAAEILAFSIWASSDAFLNKVHVHLQTCAENISEQNMRNIPTIEVVQLLFNFGHAFRLMLDFVSLQSLLRHFPKTLGDLQNEEFLLQFRVLTAVVYTNQGSTKAAVAELEGVFEVRSRTLEPHNRTLLGTQQDLARAYQENGRISEAIELFEHVVQVKNEIMEESDSSRLASQRALASVYLGNGQIHEAIDLLEHVVRVYVAKERVDHPDRLLSMAILGDAYRRNGHLKRSISILEEVVKFQKVSLRKDHPNLLHCIRLLERSYRANGQFDEADRLLRD